MVRRTDFISLSHYLLFLKEILAYISNTKKCSFVPSNVLGEIGIFTKDGIEYQIFVKDEDFDNLEFHCIEKIDIHTQRQFVDCISALEDYVSIVMWNCFFTNTLQKI